MTVRKGYYVKCDACGDTVGHSHNLKDTKEETKRAGWVRRKNQAGENIDVCAECHKFGRWQRL